MVSANGNGWYNKCCHRIPALRGAACSDTHLVFLELQCLLVSTRQAPVWPILSLVSPTAALCHPPTAQGNTEDEQGESWSRLACVLGTQSRSLQQRESLEKSFPVTQVTDKSTVRWSRPSKEHWGWAARRKRSAKPQGCCWKMETAQGHRQRAETARFLSRPSSLLHLLLLNFIVWCL